jgi:hypothetical protein
MLPEVFEQLCAENLVSKIEKNALETPTNCNMIGEPIFE